MKIKKTAIGWITLVLILSLGQSGTAKADYYYYKSKIQAANFVYLPSLDYAAGAATLTRTYNSVSAAIAAGDLDANAAYTVWWVIWNYPSKCGDACGDEDADFGVRGNAIFYAGGFVTGADGTGNLTVKLNAGRKPKGTDEVIPGELYRWRGLRAEVHVVLRTHGEIVPGYVDEQISTYFGLCGEPVDALSAPPCFDQQAAVFVP